MIRLRQNRNSRDRQRGVALIAALIALLLIAAITAGMIILANTETNISGNFRDEQTAYFASRGGLSEVRDRMRPGTADSVNAFIPPPSSLPGTANGIMYIINPLGGETVAPWNTTGNNYPDDEICKELPCTGGVPSGGTWYVNPSGSAGKGSTAYASNPQLAWKWVRVMSKVNRTVTSTRITSVDGAATSGQPTLGQRICWNGFNEVVTTLATCQAANSVWQPVYELTSLAVTASGARRIAQYELASVNLPPVPGPLVFDGPGADFIINPHSNALQIFGADIAQGPNAGAGCPAALNEPAIGTYSAADAATVTGELNRPSAYTSTDNPAPAAPFPNPPVTNVSSQLGSSYSSVDGLTNLVSTVTAAAGSNIYPNSTSSVPVNWGCDSNTIPACSPATPVINVVNGDYNGPIMGAGILLVTGTLTTSGNPSFDGLVLVIGKGEIIKNGGGNGVINGSMLVANLYSNPEGTWTNLIPLGSNLPPGIPVIQWNGGGTANINYDSCWSNLLGQTLPLRLVTSRELIY